MPLKVYYVDDEIFLLEAFSDSFSSPEVEIKTFSDPEETVKAIAAAPPDLLFLDYRLPGTTGDKLALRLDPAIPKALITGEITVKLEADFQACFNKPFNPSEIESFIQSFLKVKKN